MNPVFLDTSYLLAIEIANDQHHDVAADHFRHVEASGLPPLLTTTYVFNEVVTYLNSRGLHAKAVEVGEDLLTSPMVRLIHVDDELFQRSWRFFVQYRDKTYSLTDCASFLLMGDLGVTTAYSFDHHFRQTGFDIEP
jgi:predicted nucleic acid-binding protein